MKIFRDIKFLIGILVVAPNVISLIEHVFEIGLRDAFGDLVTYYRSILSPLLSVLTTPIEQILSLLGVNFTFPNWARDVYALSFAGAGIAIRASADTYAEGQRPRVLMAAGAAKAVTLGAVGLGLVNLLQVIAAMLGAAVWPKAPNFTRSVRRTGWAVAAAVIAFFAGGMQIDF